jgi:hypothetical protein
LGYLKYVVQYFHGFTKLNFVNLHIFQTRTE